MNLVTEYFCFCNKKFMHVIKNIFLNFAVADLNIAYEDDK